MSDMKPEDFARGAQQVLRGIAPTVETVNTSRWIRDIDKLYPPNRETKTVPIENPKRGQPTERSYMVGPENDPFVIAFLTDVLGPMVSVETADRLYQSKVSGYYGGRYEINEQVREAYGRKVCVWSPQDESWSLLFQKDEITLACHKRPSDADMQKLIFIVGWWTMRTQTHHLEGKWRRMNLTNTGELMRGK